MNIYLVIFSDGVSVRFESNCVNNLLIELMKWSTNNAKKIDFFKTYVNSIPPTKYEDAIFLLNQLVDFEDQQIKEIAVISNILYSA